MTSLLFFSLAESFFYRIFWRTYHYPLSPHLPIRRWLNVIAHAARPGMSVQTFAGGVWGLKVTDVVEGSPAALSDIRLNDVRPSYSPLPLATTLCAKNSPVLLVITCMPADAQQYIG